MGSITNAQEKVLMDLVFNKVSNIPFASVFVGLSTTVIDDTGAVTEPVGAAYARQQVTFSAPASRRVTQVGDLQFPESTGSWGTIQSWFVASALAAGTVLAYGNLNTPTLVPSGVAPKINSGLVWVEFLSSDETSNYLADSLLNHTFRNASFSPPDTFLALTTAVIAQADTGATITEPGVGAYARVLVDENGGVAPTWNLAVNGFVDNLHAAAFPEATANWGTVVAAAILDSATVGAGNLLVFDNGLIDVAIDQTETAQYAIGANTSDLD